MRFVLSLTRRRAAAVLFPRLLDRDAERLDARGQRGRLHIQQLGGAAGAEHLAAAGFQRREDVGAVALAPLVVGEQPVGRRLCGAGAACRRPAGRCAAGRGAPGSRRARSRSPVRARCRASRIASGGATSPSVSCSSPRLSLRRALQEMRGQQRNVVAALAQRQRLDREDVEPEIEVLAERPRAPPA